MSGKAKVATRGIKINYSRRQQSNSAAEAERFEDLFPWRYS